MGNVVTQWNRFIITNKGLELHQQAIATGATITFNFAKIGQGAHNPANIPSMTDIVAAVEQVPVVRSVADGVTHCVGIRIDNVTFKQPVIMTEIGLFASIGEDTPTLYGYTYATQGYDSIPAGSTSHYVWTISIDTIISRAQSISFSYDGSKVYATEDEIDDLIQSCEANEDKLNNKADKTYVDEQLGNKASKSDMSTHISNSTVHVTADEKSAWNGKADKSDIPTKTSDLTNDSGYITSADGGNATSVDSANHKARLYEDPEGGNLRLESPNGAMSMEMDMYDNKSFRIYFERNGELVFPFLYNSIYNDFEISKLNGARITSVGVKRGYTTSAIADVITYGERVVHKQSSDASYIGWTTTADGWFAPIFVSKTVEGTRYTMNGNECVYSVKGEKCGSFVYHGETYYACWNNPASLINPLVSTSALYVALSGDDYISACKTLTDICEGVYVDGGNADTLGNRPPEDFANACNGSLDLYLSGKSGDIRALAHLLPPGGFSADTSLFANVTFPISGTILLTWTRSSYRANGNIYLYGVLTVRPLASTGDTYICSVYNTSLYTDWQRLSDGGNAASVNGVSVQSNAQAVGLHQMFVGTADPASVTIPAGAWYGKHS